MSVLISCYVISQFTCKLVFYSLLYSFFLVTIATVCSSYIINLYSYVYLTILDFLHSVERAFFLFFVLLICAFLFTFSCWPVFYFYLILILTGCLALLAFMVIPGYSRLVLYL